MKKNEKKLYKSNKNVSDADYDIKKFLIILNSYMQDGDAA